MLRPDFKEFERLARDATLVPVAKSISADLLTPVSAFLMFAADEPYSFLLESVEGGEKVGRYTFLGARPYMRVIARGGKVEIVRGKKTERRKSEPIAVIRELLHSHKPAQVPGLPPFTGGAVGFFAYDMVRQFERLPNIAKDDLDVPDCALMFFDRLLAFDHVRHQIHIIATADVSREKPKQAYARALRDIEAIEKRLKSGLKPSQMKARRHGGKLKIKTHTSRKRYMKAVEDGKEYIAAGDIFQVVLSQRMDFEPKADPFTIYRALRTVNPSPYMYFLSFGKNQVLGSSPEMLVRVTGRKLEYRPIAGTRPRGRDEAEDRQIEQELR